MGVTCSATRFIFSSSSSSRSSVNSLLQTKTHKCDPAPLKNDACIYTLLPAGYILLLELSNFSIYRRRSTNIDSNVIRMFKTGFITFAESSAAPQSTQAPSSGSSAPPAGCRPHHAPAGVFRQGTRPPGVVLLLPNLAWPLRRASWACGAMATWIR